MSGKTKTNMFAAFGSDSDGEEENKANKNKAKTAAKEVAPKVKKDETNQVVGTRITEDGDYANYNARKSKPARGRGTRGRGEGRGEGRGGRGVARGEGRGGRGVARGEGRGGYRGRGEGRGGYRGRGEGGFGGFGESRGGYRGRGESRGGYRGRGENRGRGARGRGARGDKNGPHDTYSHHATREEIAGGEQQESHELPGSGPTDHRNKKTFDRKGGNAHTGPRKVEEVEQKQFENMDAGEAAVAAEELAEGHAPTQEKHIEQVEATEAPEEVEEDINNFTYQDYLEQRKQDKNQLKKPEGRKPEEIKEKNIQKYEKDDNSKKTINSKIKSNESHNIAGFKADCELGFQPVGEEEEEEENFDRPRGDRGRGGRGRGDRGRGARGRGDRGRGDRGRGGFQGDRKPHGNKKFNALDEEFPTL